MKRSILGLFLAVLTSASSANAQRRIDMSFEGQMTSAVEELKEKMEADPDIQGRKLRLGKFSGPNLPDSSFDLQFEQAFKQLMTELLVEESPLVVNGEYKFLPGELRENADLKVIQFVISITRRFRPLQTVTREINCSADIAKITGTTVALPDTTRVEDRNEAALEAVVDPKFRVRDKHFVTAVSHDRHAVAIMKKTNGTGESEFVVPRNVNGFAFVDLGVNDTFIVVLRNHDTRCDASAEVTIDGLDVANTFSEDKVEYSGYGVPRAVGAQPGQHSIPGWLRTATVSKDNVFQFVVKEIGQGAATAMQSRHRLGTIHVEFYEAAPPGEQLPSRSFGEVGQGRPIDVRYKSQPVKRRESPIASVSIRYSNPDRKVD